jgi:hypothetical protein
MSEPIAWLSKLLEHEPDYILGKYIDTKGNVLPDVLEVFSCDRAVPISDVVKAIKDITQLKVLKVEVLQRTLIVGEWKAHDCHKCGQQMSSIAENGQTRYFCNQCVEFK